MGYDGFKLFMSVYLGQSVGDELMQTLFWTFHKKVPRGDAKSPDLPDTILQKILIENGNHSQESLDQLNGTFIVVAHMATFRHGACSPNYNLVQI